MATTPKELFIAFLENRYIYEKFIHNLETRRSSFDEFYNERERANYLGALISSAFTWGDTPEGHSFWGEYSNEWRKQYATFTSSH